MIARYYAKCDSCGSITILRLGIGFDEAQNFKYECENCNQEINGSLNLNQEKGIVGKLTLVGAKIVDAQDYDYVFTYHPFFLNQTSKNEFSSPFVDAASRNIDDFPRKIMKSALFKRAADNDVPALKKIYKNYKQKKWTHFSKSVKEYLPDLPIEKQVDRNRALYQILELCAFPIVTSQQHVDRIKFLMIFLIELRQKDEKLFMAFITYLQDRKILETIQDKSFNYTFRFFEFGKELTPIIVEWDPDNPDKVLSKDLRIMSDAPFDKVKSFYVDGFELVCDALVIIQGLINIKYRRDYESFPEHPTINKGYPFAKNLDDFHKKSNAPKLGILFEEKSIETWLNSALDQKLRNAIGHGDLEYDKTTEIIKYSINREHTEFVTLTYVDFLLKCIKLFTVVHDINHLVKMHYVHFYLSPKTPGSPDSG